MSLLGIDGQEPLGIEEVLSSKRMLQIRDLLEDKAIRLKSPVLNISTRSYATELGIDLNSQLWTLEAVKRDFYVYITFLKSTFVYMMLDCLK